MNIASRLFTMNPDERGRLADQIAGQAARVGAPQVAEAMGQAAEALRNGNLPAAAQLLQQIEQLSGAQHRQPAAQSDDQARRQAQERQERSARSGGARLRINPLLEALSPKWGLKAAQWVASQNDPTFKATALVIAVLLLLVGLALLLGSGYASIQGVRMPLAAAGLPIPTDDFPSAAWWLIPLAIGLVEILPKAIPGLRPIWWPAVVYDGATTALFVVIGLARILLAYDHSINMIVVSIVAAGIGLFAAISAEKIVIVAAVLIAAARQRR